MISEEKGRGLVTNRDVKIGQVVLEEAPLLFIKRSKSSRDSGQTRAEDVIQYQIEVLKCYERLDGRSKEKFNELHYIAKKGGTNNKTLNIWFSNCLAIQLHDEEDEDRGLFSLFSKTNHSCEPNCVINFTEERKLKLVAVQPIQRGGEVLVSFLHPHGGWDNLLRLERQTSLREIFQFTCGCRICSLTGKKLASNERLKSQLRGMLKHQAEYPCPCLEPCSNNTFRETQSRQRFVENIKKKLVIELEIADTMIKLGVEMIRDIHPSFHRCYLYAKLVTICGVKLTKNPQDFRKTASEGAAMLGDSYNRYFRDRDELYYQTIMRVTAQVVESNKVLVYQVYTETSKDQEEEGE